MTCDRFFQLAIPCYQSVNTDDTQIVITTDVIVFPIGSLSEAIAILNRGDQATP